MILQAFETLVQVLDPDDEVGDRVKEPVEEECGIADRLLGVTEAVDDDREEGVDACPSRRWNFRGFSLGLSVSYLYTLL